MSSSISKAPDVAQNQLNDKIVDPHASFFKSVMDQRKVAIDFFTNYLPAIIQKLIDINTLKIKKGSFVEKELKKFYSDILYEVASKQGRIYLYLLFEHQSGVDK